jgi:OFA family oxalate/formate antiporter-like MFS transporter
VRKPVFWLMYLMFVLVASGGLMAAAQIAPLARDFQVAGVEIDLLGLSIPTLTLAISLDRVLDGLGRPFFGWLSDLIGRENTMFIAFSTAACALVLLIRFGSVPVLFVAFSAMFFCVFGEIYSLFPATSGDTFGSRHAATNAGMLYTAKGTAALLVPLTSVVAAAYGWYAVLTLAVAFNIAAATLAIFVLKPLRSGFLRRSLATEIEPRPSPQGVA